MDLYSPLSDIDMFIFRAGSLVKDFILKIECLNISARLSARIKLSDGRHSRSYPRLNDSFGQGAGRAGWDF